MGDFINLLKALPAIIEAIKALEAAIPFSGFGKDKLDFILVVAKDFGVNADRVTTVVNTLVSLFKKTGTFA